MGGLTLVNGLLQFGHLILVEQDFELASFGPTFDQEIESLNDLVPALDNLIMELRDHLVLHDVLKESVRNVLFSILVIDLLFKDDSEPVPPSSKLSGRLKDVNGQLFKLSPQLINGWMECDFWMRVVTDHLDQARPISALIDGLVSSQGSHN